MSSEHPERSVESRAHEAGAHASESSPRTRRGGGRPSNGSPRNGAAAGPVKSGKAGVPGGGRARSAARPATGGASGSGGGGGGGADGATSAKSLVRILSKRQRQVLRMIGWGWSAAQMAARLKLSVKTVDSHRRELGVRLGVRNRVELARIAIRAGLAPLPTDKSQTEEARINEALRAEVAHRRRAQEALRAIDAGTGATAGRTFFDALVRHLTAALRVRFAWIGSRAPDRPSHVSVIAACFDGKLLEPYEYDSTGTTCEQVLRDGLQYHANGWSPGRPMPKPMQQLAPTCYVGAPLTDTGGHAIGILGLLHDEPVAEGLQPELIVRIFAARAAAELERARTEDALLRSERLLGSIINNTTAVVYVKNINGQYLLVNSQFERLFNFTNEDLRGRTDYDLFPAVNAQAFRANDLQVLQAGTAIVSEEYAPHSDGMHTYVSVKFPLFDAEGKAYATCGISTDITDRKRAEEALRQAHDELEMRVIERTQQLLRTNESLHIEIADRKRAEEERRESQRILQTLISNLPGIAYRCANDPDWTMEFVSEGSLDLTGYQASDLIGNRRISYARIIHPDDRRAVWDQVQEGLGQRRPYRMVYRIITAAGQTKWVWEQGRGVFDAGGTLVALEGFITDITDRKHAEDALKSTERRYRDLVENAVDMMYALDTSGLFTYVSTTLLRAVGYERHELIGQWARMIIAEEDHDKTDRAFAARLRGEVVAPYEFHLEAKDGRLIPVEIASNIIYEADGEIAGTQAILRDVTERLRAQRALRESEQRFRALAEHSNVGIWHIRPDGGTLYINPAMCRKLQVDGPASMSGVTFHRFFSPQTLAVMQREHEKRRAGVPGSYEVELIGAKGERRNLIISGAPLMNSDGSLHSLIGTFTDISDRRQAEENVRQSEERYRRLVESAPDAIFVHRDSRIVYCNDAAAAMFGARSRQDLVGRDILDMVHPDDHPLIHRRRQQLSQGDISVPLVQLRQMRMDGSIINTEATGTAIVYEGEPAVQVIVRDVTHRMNTERLQAGVRRVLEMITLGDPQSAVLPELIRVIEQRHAGMLCSVLLLDAKAGRLRHGAAPSLPEAYNRAVEGFAIGPSAGSCGTCAFTGQRVVAEDIATDPRWSEFSEIALAHNLRACWSEPILSSSGAVLGTFAMYYGQPRRPNEEEISLIETAARLAAIAIEHERDRDSLRLRSEHERLLRKELDHRVRNSLSALGAVVELARAGAPSIDEFAAAVTRRIEIVFLFHKLLSEPGGASFIGLRRLLQTIVQISPQSAIELEGPDVAIPSRQATALGMVLHELLINSIKHGALSVPGGRAGASWTLEGPSGGAGQLVFRWTEQGGPPIESEPRPGAGLQLVEGLARADLRGSVEWSFPREGARYQLTIGLDADDEPPPR